ncbi:MAG: polysaccharide biosynthesis/export family protein [Candidatus Hydrogenedentes bacterium]|nr:polysaccharide biosynthesis/export family protein [Candidatus Hydrogenedentota bacterium]
MKSGTIKTTLHRAIGALAILLLGAGCATTKGISVMGDGGKPRAVTADEVDTLSGGDRPYLLQVGDQIALGFKLQTVKAKETPWDYRIEIGDSMEVRLSTQTANRDTYKIDVGDVIGVSFLTNWPLNVTRTVRPDGRISVAQLGDVKAAGLTAPQLQSALTSMYAKSGLVQGNPDVTVNVDFVNLDRLESRSRDVVVRPDGAIALPRIGNAIHIAGMTLTEASEAIRAETAKSLQDAPQVSLVVFPYVNTVLNGMGANQTIRPDGKIAIPRLGEIQAAGFSAEELKQSIKTLCADVIHNPVDPTVDVITATGSRIYVGGEVGAPGVYPISASPTALQAIILAQGEKNTGRLNGVLVVRRNPDGKPFVFTVNLHEALYRGSTENDIRLRPFDVVYVPKKPIAKADLFVDQYINQLVPFDNSLGVSGSYYLNKQRVESKSRNRNITFGAQAVPTLTLP